jgi:Cys-tRNA(Pro) deacylase|tara:strand:- start:1957 stop:2439 length:483 start_codon:yes stop_codon:yes gene_type:complete
MNELLNKEPVKRVQKKLLEFDASYKVMVLASSARTAQEAAESLNTDVGSIVKSLLFKSENNFILCLVSGDRRCSLNKLKKIKQQKDISMANPQSVKEVTGFTIGGVSPIGHLKEVEIFIDNNLKRFQNIYAAAGHPNCVYKVNFENLLKMTSGKVEDFTE